MNLLVAVKKKIHPQHKCFVFSWGFKLQEWRPVKAICIRLHNNDDDFIDHRHHHTVLEVLRYEVGISEDVLGLPATWAPHGKHSQTAPTMITIFYHQQKHGKHARHAIMVSTTCHCNHSWLKSAPYMRQGRNISVSYVNVMLVFQDVNYIA